MTALVRERWWDFNGRGRLDEIDEGAALELLTWLFGHTLEGDDEVLPFDRARELTAQFVSLFPERRRWFGNDREGPPFPGPVLDEKEFQQTDWAHRERPPNRSRRRFGLEAAAAPARGDLGAQVRLEGGRRPAVN